VNAHITAGVTALGRRPHPKIALNHTVSPWSQATPRADRLKEELPMLEFERPADIKEFAGKALGSSDWVTIDQQRINAFADATDDHQWIHVDVERAKREMPGGKTIAHGFLTMSLLPRLGEGIFKIRNTSREINYGANKLRFTRPVQAGSRVRLHQVLKSVEDIEGGVRVTLDSTIELEGSDKPALVAEVVYLFFD
jgi:acyl dehydratase